LLLKREQDYVRATQHEQAQQPLTDNMHALSSSTVSASASGVAWLQGDGSDSNLTLTLQQRQPVYLWGGGWDMTSRESTVRPATCRLVPLSFTGAFEVQQRAKSLQINPSGWHLTMFASLQVLFIDRTDQMQGLELAAGFV